MKFKSAAWVGFAAVAAFAVGPVVLPGCSSEEKSQSLTMGRPEFHVKSSSGEIVQGEIVTFTTRSANTAGRPSQIEWSTTGGELTTEADGQVARVKFDRPGTYTVIARLLLDHELVESDLVTVKVKSLMPK